MDNNIESVLGKYGFNVLIFTEGGKPIYSYHSINELSNFVGILFAIYSLASNSSMHDSQENDRIREICTNKYSIVMAQIDAVILAIIADSLYNTKRLESFLNSIYSVLVSNLSQDKLNLFLRRSCNISCSKILKDITSTLDMCIMNLFCTIFGSLIAIPSASQSISNSTWIKSVFIHYRSSYMAFAFLFWKNQLLFHISFLNTTLDKQDINTVLTLVSFFNRRPTESKRIWMPVSLQNFSKQNVFHAYFENIGNDDELLHEIILQSYDDFDAVKSERGIKNNLSIMILSTNADTLAFNEISSKSISILCEISPLLLEGTSVHGEYTALSLNPRLELLPNIQRLIFLEKATGFACQKILLPNFDNDNDILNFFYMTTKGLALIYDKLEYEYYGGSFVMMDFGDKKICGMSNQKFSVFCIFEINGQDNNGEVFFSDQIIMECMTKLLKYATDYKFNLFPVSEKIN